MQGPGHGRVQYCMASMLATLVLDDGVMELIKQRHEGHLVVEAMLKLLSMVMNALKFSLAVGDEQILGEGMTQAEVKAAIEKLRSGSLTLSAAGRLSAEPSILQAAARRLSHQEAAAAAAPAARQLSTDAQQAAELLVEASTASKTSAGGAVKLQHSETGQEEDAPEPLDVKTAVSLAEACAQAMWGAAAYSLEEPLHITQVSLCQHLLGPDMQSLQTSFCKNSPFCVLMDALPSHVTNE